MQGLTFDFWDTIVQDNSDELERQHRGLPGKAEARRQLFVSECQAHHQALTSEQCVKALQDAATWCTKRWKQDDVTPTATVRLQKAFEVLGIEPTPGFDKLVREFEVMEVEIAPRLTPGIAEILRKLKRTYRLGIISDTIVTPGWGLREILDRAELLAFFDVCVFSDEAGCSKPDPQIYQKAAEGLRLPLSQITHIGDREANDIVGAQAVGMKAILYTGVVDRGAKGSQADGICGHHQDLPKVLKSLQENAQS